MNWFEKIKAYYEKGYYTIEQVKDFVEANKITIEEYEKIVKYKE